MKLRINAYERDTFKLISSAVTVQDEIMKNLDADKRKYLMDANNRDELGKYLIENIIFEGNSKRMVFL